MNERARKVPIREADFLNWFLDVAQRFGWRTWHVPFPVRAVGAGKFVPERRAAGLPDVVAMHRDPPRLIFVELKGEAGVLSDGQREFLRLARGVSDLIAQGFPGEVPVPENERNRLGVRVVGAYSFRPGMEEAIEAMLRSRVLM